MEKTRPGGGVAMNAVDSEKRIIGGPADAKRKWMMTRYKQKKR
jgi:hypothetical protein